MHPRPLARIALLLLIATISIPLRPADSAATPAAPLKPYGRLVDEVAGFLFADTGDKGLLSDDGEPVPPYFYHYGIYDWDGLWSGGEGYPGYAAVSYPAYTASVGIDAFLDYHAYRGSAEALARARGFADWILRHLTPAEDLYGGLPYSTQTDGVMGGGWDGDAIMTDKPAMFGLRLLRLFDVTADSTYWTGAEKIAATLAATQLDGDTADRGRWPFRVRPSDGAVRQDYTSHLMPAVRFFDAMAERTGDAAFAEVRDRAWRWLLDNPCNPASPHYMRWEGFYEDQDPEMQTGKHDHYSAHEMIVELVARRPEGWRTTARNIMDLVKAEYLLDSPDDGLGDYHPATLEWKGWMVSTFASTLQFARTALLLDRAMAGDPLRDPDLPGLAAGMAIVATWGQNTRCTTLDGRMYTTVDDVVSYGTSTSWYEQNFNTVKYMLEMMALDPSLAPADEPHLLASETPVLDIAYPPESPRVVYSVSGDAGCETLHLPAEPAAVLAAGAELPRVAALDGSAPGWTWDAASGVLEVRHAADPVEILSAPVAVETLPGQPAVMLGARTGSGLSGAVVDLSLSHDAAVVVTVFDLRGRLVQELVDGDVLPAGVTRLTWDGRDRSGRRSPTGVYLMRARTAGGEAILRLRVMR